MFAAKVTKAQTKPADYGNRAKHAPVCRTRQLASDCDRVPPGQQSLANVASSWIFDTERGASDAISRSPGRSLERSARQEM